MGKRRTLKVPPNSFLQRVSDLVSQTIVMTHKPGVLWHVGNQVRAIEEGLNEDLIVKFRGCLRYYNDFKV